MRLADGLGKGLNAGCFIKRQETKVVEYSSHFQLYQKPYLFAFGSFMVLS